MEHAARAGLAVVALTDHDAFSGLAEAEARATELGMEFVPGVEISTEHPEGGERHLLAYAMDTSHDGLRTALDANRAERETRLDRMLVALAAFNLRLTREDVTRHA